METEKGPEFLFHRSKSVIHTMINIQKTSTRNNSTPSGRDQDQTTLRNCTYNLKPVYGKPIVNDTSILNRRNRTTIQPNKTK